MGKDATGIHACGQDDGFGFHKDRTARAARGAGRPHGDDPGRHPAIAAPAAQRLGENPVRRHAARRDRRPVFRINIGKAGIATRTPASTDRSQANIDAAGPAAAADRLGEKTVRGIAAGRDHGAGLVSHRCRAAITAGRSAVGKGHQSHCGPGIPADPANALRGHAIGRLTQRGHIPVIGRGGRAAIAAIIGPAAIAENAITGAAIAGATTERLRKDTMGANAARGDIGIAGDPGIAAIIA